MYMYLDDEKPEATVQQVMEVIADGHIADCDGVYASTWISNLRDYDDLSYDLIQYIVRNRNNPTFRPLVEMIEISIDSMLEN